MPRSHVMDTIHSKAGLRCLNEATASTMAVMVWKAKKEMNSLWVNLFSEKNYERKTRFAVSDNICPPVPGYQSLPSNLMARVWNSVPGLQSATSLGKAKSLARIWARTIPR